MKIKLESDKSGVFLRREIVTVKQLVDFIGVENANVDGAGGSAFWLGSMTEPKFSRTSIYRVATLPWLF